MQRHQLRTLTTGACLLAGIAGLLAASGCAALPAVGMVNSLMKPTQAVSTGTASSSPDIFSTIAQHLGVSLPGTTPAKPAPTQTAAAVPPAAPTEAPAQ